MSASSRKDLWGGRFSAAPAPALRRFNDSFAFDREMFAEDVEGSIAWVGALRRARVLSPSEATRLGKALRKILAAGPPAGSGDFEDVHSFVEAQARKFAGPVAGKLHTGRSRNDQVATGLRLYLRRCFSEARENALRLAETLVRRAEREASTPMPAYTHGKRAEPVTFGHWCLAHVEMILRDAERLAQANARADECPLGSGALSGSPLRVDRAALARSLGFRRPSANSLDAVSDRDAAADYLYAGSMLLSHLSRLAADVISFSSDELAFVEIPDRLSTGSSRMPHKKNPDVLELVRGHAGRSVGELAGLLALLKGLPLAYNKDLQLDKEPVFRMRAVLAAGLPAMNALLSGLKLDRVKMKEAASADALLATELADAMARRGIPFRRAHELVGQRVAEALRRGRSIRSLPATRDVTRADLASLDVGRALARRAALGGTSPKRVAEAAREARRRIRLERGRP
ncbi:MAG: argininosuccinate lyase [Thermoanaerobaculia bacterium]